MPNETQNTYVNKYHLVKNPPDKFLLTSCYIEQNMPQGFYRKKIVIDICIILYSETKVILFLQKTVFSFFSLLLKKVIHVVF